MFMEFDIEEFCKKIVYAFQFQLKSDKSAYFTLRHTFLCVSLAELVKYLLKQKCLE
jgi:hypothetical protein